VTIEKRREKSLEEEKTKELKNDKLSEKETIVCQYKINRNYG
jgi:hypothetical protein